MLRFVQRSTLRAALLLGFVLGGSLAPPVLRAQHIGDVSLTTTTQILANNVACTGNTQNFPVANLGQSFHLATAAIVSGAGGSFVMEIDGIDAVANAFKISNPMLVVGTNSFIVQGTGFLPIIRVSLICTSGNNFSLSYSGSFASNSINAGGAGSGSVSSITGGNVQGVIPTGQNGAPIFPVIGGTILPAVNTLFAASGVDNLGTGSAFIAALVGAPGSAFSISPPAPSAAGEWGYAAFGSTSKGTVQTFNGPWTCIEASCNNSLNHAFLPLGINNVLSGSITNAAAAYYINAVFAVFSKAPTIRQHNESTSTTLAFPGNTLAGSTLVADVLCNATPCQITSVADTQGGTWKQVGAISNTLDASGGLSMWINTTPSTAAADTVTPTPAAGTTINAMALVELTGITPANLNTPSNPLLADAAGNLLVRSDAGAPYSCTVTISAINAVSCQPAPATGLRNYVQSYQIFTSTAGTATTITVTDSANACTTNANLTPSYANTAVTAVGSNGIFVNFDGSGLVPPTATAICVAQAGTTAGTSTVTVNGFIAP